MIVSSAKGAPTGVGGSWHPALRRLHTKISKGEAGRPRASEVARAGRQKARGGQGNVKEKSNEHVDEHRL